MHAGEHLYVVMAEDNSKQLGIRVGETLITMDELESAGNPGMKAYIDANLRTAAAVDGEGRYVDELGVPIIVRPKLHIVTFARSPRSAG